MEKIENVFFTHAVFILRDQWEITSKRFFRDSGELAKFIDRILDKYDDHPSIYYTSDIYRYFGSFKRVNGSEHGRRADEFNNNLEYEEEKCYIPSGNACFLKCINYTFKKNVSKEYFEFIQSYERRTNAMTRCRLPEFCELYKLDTGKYDKGKRLLPRSVEKNICSYVHKNHYCGIREKNREDSLLNAVDEMEKNLIKIRKKEIISVREFVRDFLSMKQ